MKTILVPVDFTSTSNNAVNFAVEWSKRYGYRQIILFKTFYESMFEFMAVASDYTIMNSENLNASREEALEQLRLLRDELSRKIDTDITISTFVSELPLLRGLIELVQSEEAPELIILGSDHNIQSTNSSITTHIIGIAKASPVKVLIVPSGYNYKAVRNVLVPCDITASDILSKLETLKNNSKLEGTRLLILHVDTKSTSDNKNVEIENRIHACLEDFPHEIFYTPGKDVISGILSFAAENEAELIIALPGRHSFLYRLVNKSISEAIYKNVNQPVLILK